MYFYKKSDKNKENAIHISEAVQFKTLWNKAEKLQSELAKIQKTLMFQGESVETKGHLYQAIDSLQKFKHNLNIKKGFEEAE